MELISIGKIVGTQGNKGEVKVFPLTDFPERFEKLKEVYLGKGRRAEVEGFRYHKGRIILKFRGFDSLEKAQQLKDETIMLEEKDAVKLPQGSYFVHDIIGLDVFVLEGKYLGKIKEVLSTPGNDIYVIAPPASGSSSPEEPESGKSGQTEKEILIPATKELVKKIDLEKRRMSISLMKGLI